MSSHIIKDTYGNNTNANTIGSKVLLSIVYLRVIATFLITNSHFKNIWPISALASGGLLGDILFFAISGYCLSGI